MPNPHGSLFMIVAPSGAGKSSLVDALLAQDPSIMLSISCTTRAPRPGEAHEKHYRFMDQAGFLALRDAGELLEWAEVHGNYYGTPRDRIDASLQSGRDVLLEIDWQGARQVRRHVPDTISIFILPPSLQTLADRLTRRGQDSAEIIARRLQAAESEMNHAAECEYVIINQEFSVALQELSHIVAAARLRYRPQSTRHAPLFAALGADRRVD